MATIELELRAGKPREDLPGRASAGGSQAPRRLIELDAEQHVVAVELAADHDALRLLFAVSRR